jgi:hypothetical protein
MTIDQLVSPPISRRSWRLAATTVALALAPILAACEQSAETAAPADACRSWAAALCAKVAKCQPIALAAEYTDEAACVATESRSCTLGLGVTDSAETASGRVSCAKLLTSSSCDTFLYGE